MLDFSDSFKKLFIYSEKKEEYDFFLPQVKNEKDEAINLSLDQPIYNELDKNLDFLKTSYNSMINSDIVLREFMINAKGRKYKALLVTIDGMVDSELVNNYLLKPLMLHEPSSNKMSVPIPASIKSKFNTKDFNLADYLFNLLIPQNSIQKVTTFFELVSNVNSGSSALIVDSLALSFVIDTKGFNTRSVSTPINETIIMGAQEGFTEKLRTNTSMLRRVINNENLIIEKLEVREI